MRSVRNVLASAVVMGLASQVAMAEDLSSHRAQLGRGTSARVTLDRSGLVEGQLTLTGNEKGSRIVNGRRSDLSAADMSTLARALQHIRDLAKKKLTSDSQIRNGDPLAVPPVPGLTPEEQRVLAIMEIPNRFSFARASSAIILPNQHQLEYYAFDIDRVLRNESVVIPRGLMGEPDVLIPVKPVKYERIVSTSADSGLTGGWNSGTSNVTAPHYRVPIPMYAVRSDGTVARDPNFNPPRLVPLQLLGPGNWYDTRPENLRPEYSYNANNGTFRVAMGIDANDSTPDVFPGGGHIACYWIYDFANPPNCHATARSGDPVSIGAGQGDGNPNAGYGQYGSTVVVAVDNSGQDN